MTDHFQKSRGNYSPTQDSLQLDFEDKVDTDLTARDYYNSNFPSLLTQLGTNSRHRARTRTMRKQVSIVRNENSRNQSVVEVMAVRQRKSNEKWSFAEEMRKRNEVQWMRIQAVAQEKMDNYDKYAMEMLVKVKKQREQINRRSMELLETLAREQEKKRENHLYDSSQGRIWRHHRTMQRRALSLEPMTKKNRQISTTTAPGSNVTT